MPARGLCVFFLTGALLWKKVQVGSSAKTSRHLGEDGSQLSCIFERKEYISPFCHKARISLLGFPEKFSSHGNLASPLVFVELGFW